jgi:hypothetical protein
MEQFVLFVKEESHGKVSNLLFGVLISGDEVDSLEVSEVDIPPEDVYIQQL